MTARAWDGYTRRWEGESYVAISPFPVILVGHDGADGGGMRGASTSIVIGVQPGRYSTCLATSTMGFLVWTVVVSGGSGFPGRLGVIVRPDDPGIPSSPVSLVRYLQGASRDVVWLAGTLPTPQPTGMIFQLATSVGIPSPLTFARPVIVPPRQFLQLWAFFDPPADQSDNLELAVTFEEGL